VSLSIGDTIDGKYRIVRLLGEGGMGAVYEGENVRIHRRVAIKILHSNVADSEDAVQRFEREAQAAGRIGSEHIVEVLDLGDLPDGDRYMVMEYLDGEALNDRIANAGAMSAYDVAPIAVELLEGLHAAHEAGIIHRDLKPDNVFLLANKSGKKDFVKIVDFGISKFSALGGEFSMTRTGAVMGTPYYLSPEQAKGDRELDQRADLYAVGVILYEAAAGRVPFDGETFNELLFKIVLEPVPPLSTVVPDIDPDFEKLVRKSMARDPADRFQSAAEMQAALRAWLDGAPVPLLSDTHSAGMAGPGDGGTNGTTPSPNQAPEIGRTVVDGTPGKTHGAWANTNGDVPAAANSKKWVALAAAALLLAGGGVFLLQSNQAASDAAMAAAQASEERERALVEKMRADELERLEADKARAETDKEEAERAKAEAEKAAVDAKQTAAELALQQQEAKRKEEEEELAKARARAVSRPRPKAAPTPAPSPTPARGRKFRSEL